MNQRYALRVYRKYEPCRAFCAGTRLRYAHSLLPSSARHLPPFCAADTRSPRQDYPSRAPPIAPPEEGAALPQMRGRHLGSAAVERLESMLVMNQRYALRVYRKYEPCRAFCAGTRLRHALLPSSLPHIPLSVSSTLTHPPLRRYRVVSPASKKLAGPLHSQYR
jgi:hypothetical protein